MAESPSSAPGDRRLSSSRQFHFETGDGDRYPILVKQWRGNQSLIVVCEYCDGERAISSDELRNEGGYSCPVNAGCPGSAVMKYEEADECPGCKTLGFYRPEVNAGCCSRKCMFQAEYAESLRGAA